MAINLLALQPHKVSRDLSGYLVYLYGAPKTGKTTLASQAGKSLILAFERGYNALPGVYAQDIGTWGDVRAVVRELKKAEVKEMFKTIVFDTVDIAGTLCEKYVCNQNNVEKIGDIPYGQGWNLMRKEFESVVRDISQLGYALFFISHDKDKEFKRKDGTSYHQIVPSCPTTFNEIVKNLVDIYAYAEKYDDQGVARVRLTIRSTDNSIDCGSRFRFIEPVVDMSYSALVDALNKAIDKDAEVYGADLITNERNIPTEVKQLDYDELIQEFNQLTSQLMTWDAETFTPKVTYIVSKYLGTNKKVSESTPAQVELIEQIVEELKLLVQSIKEKAKG